MADAGLGPLLITTEIAGQPKMARLVALRKRPVVLAAVDDMDTAREPQRARHARPACVSTCSVDVNVGQERPA